MIRTDIICMWDCLNYDQYLFLVPLIDYRLMLSISNIQSNVGYFMISNGLIMICWLSGNVDMFGFVEDNGTSPSNQRCIKKKKKKKERIKPTIITLYQYSLNEHRCAVTEAARLSDCNNSSTV